MCKSGVTCQKCAPLKAQTPASSFSNQYETIGGDDTQQNFSGCFLSQAAEKISATKSANLCF